MQRYTEPISDRMNISYRMNAIVKQGIDEMLVKAQTDPGIIEM